MSNHNEIAALRLSRRRFFVTLAALVSVPTTVIAQSAPPAPTLPSMSEAVPRARFHRYAVTRIDDTTVIDMIKDVATQQCHAVYLRTDATGKVTAKVNMGSVPCLPIPVPPKR